DEYRKASTFVPGIIAAVGFCSSHAVAYTFIDYYWATYILSFTTLFLVAIAFIFKKTASFPIAGNLYTLSAFISTSFLALTSGTISGPLFFVLCPIYSFFYVSRKSGYFWLIPVFMIFLGFNLLRVVGYELPVLYDPKWIPLHELVLCLGVAFFGVNIVMTYEKEKDKLMLQLQDAFDDISEQNQEITQQNEEIRQQQEEITTINENLEQEKDKLVEANDLIRATNKNMTDSIRYASTIQKAVLPDRSYVEKIFSDLFILYKPKDIVSGDFYWVTQVGNKKVIAVCDCTGHGVPGAFMSMIGSMLLTEIVSKQQFTDPDQILELMDSNVRKRLNQKEGENKDGMDICLCVIEEQGEKVQVSFAGAKRDLYYNSEGALGLLKGNRRTIGGFMISKEGFTKINLSLKKDDIIYLSTDGLFDQANHEREKFGSQRFREFVALYKQESMQQQYALLDHMLGQHQTDTPQRDDITLIGIKL
ncbi:MAG: SpoIIE family protein phosphatase, partial [Bacteroidota bacterium]